jgi:hypothetical protein
MISRESGVHMPDDRCEAGVAAQGIEARINRDQLHPEATVVESLLERGDCMIRVLQVQQVNSFSVSSTSAPGLAGIA